MYEFHKSEDIWTEQVTFCISVTINEYFLRFADRASLYSHANKSN